MTDIDIEAEIGKAAVDLRRCRDRVSCYGNRLDRAIRGLDEVRRLWALTDAAGNPIGGPDHGIPTLESDPREDARGYIESLREQERLEDFLRRHNAL